MTPEDEKRLLIMVEGIAIHTRSAAGGVGGLETYLERIVQVLEDIQQTLSQLASAKPSDDK